MVVFLTANFFPEFRALQVRPITKGGMFMTKPSLLLCLAVCFTARTLAASTDCYATFQNTKGPNAMSYCITANGNILQITGEGVSQLGAYEGYEVIVNDPFTGDQTSYYDYAVSGARFGAPQIIQPHGPNTLPLKITRQSSISPSITLEQTFRKDASDSSALFVDMKITFFQDWPRVRIFLSRSADVVADADAGNTVASFGSHSVLASKKDGHGLLIGVVSPIDDFTESFASDGSCIFAFHAPASSGVQACATYSMLLPHHIWNGQTCCDAFGAARKVTYQYKLF